MTEGSALDPRFVPYRRFVGRLRAIAVSAVAFLTMVIVLITADERSLLELAAVSLIAVGSIALAAWLAEAWPLREYAHTRYRLDQDGLQIARGVYWRGITHVPRTRVQHTDVSQGPIERRYGLGTLIVYTAGTNHARIALPGLAFDTAVALRDELRTDRAHDDV
jgi:membrane protein YdbS with pleckstrin-like domain